MLNNIVDNFEQCGQQNIVHGCFHQARTGCSFFAVYWSHISRAQRSEPVGASEVCVPAHVALRMFIVLALVGQLSFLANRNAELVVSPLLSQLHKNWGGACWLHC